MTNIARRIAQGEIETLTLQCGLSPKIVSVPSFPWPQDLVGIALTQFCLPGFTDHGLDHWARVKYHGVYLSLIYGVNPYIPALFALFHDCRRQNEFHDPEHGSRASDLVDDLAKAGLLGKYLNNKEVGLLRLACAQHSDGHQDGPIEVQVCWDADRLDLGRVGKRPDPSRLCTEAAKGPQVIERALNWSRGFSWRGPN